MPAAPFAALEARVNAAVFARLANVVVVIGGVQQAAIFDNGYVEPFGVAGRAARLHVPSSAAANVQQGAAVVIGSTQYVVASIEPDGTGVTTLGLERAA